MRIILLLLLLAASPAHASVVTLIGEFIGKVEKCDNLITYAGIDTTTDFNRYWGPTANYYLGFDADLKLFSDGHQSLTINGQTFSFMPNATVFTVFHTSAADAAANDGIPWIEFDSFAQNIYGGAREIILISDFTPGVPEPATWAMMLVGLALLWFMRAGSPLGSHWRARAAARREAASA